MDVQRLGSGHRQMVLGNLVEFGDAADSLNWISQAGAVAAEMERGQRLAAMGEHLHMACKATKPHLGSLSPGCLACGQGQWSCLFINGRCNCHCFYCPSPQDDISVPTTNRLPFAKPADYTAYVAHFGFQGVSISGGEPLMTPDRTLRFLEALNQSSQRPRHLWMYTNGTLLTADLVRQLAHAGLNEIRFDLSAVDYHLKNVRLAVGQIPIVTVEIPAIPEDRQRLERLLPVLKETGIDHLNLHQLRLTPHNRANLAQRTYTYLHGERVTVLESELAALALMQQVVERGIGLAVNYCSFVYKHRFQRAAARRRSARLMAKPNESITENGYIRSLCLMGDPEALGRQVRQLAQHGVDPRLWTTGGYTDRMYFHPDLWAGMKVGTDRFQLAVSYFEAMPCPHISYHRTFKTVRLSREKEIFLEKQPVGCQTILDDDQRRRFVSMVLDPQHPIHPLAGSTTDAFMKYEFISPGLQDYF
jgi:uncharacterized protein